MLLQEFFETVPYTKFFTSTSTNNQQQCKFVYSLIPDWREVCYSIVTNYRCKAAHYYNKAELVIEQREIMAQLQTNTSIDT